MSSRPRRSAAARAKEVISVHARWADTSEKEDAGTTTMSSRRTGRGAGATASRDTASSPEETHLSVTVKLPSSRQRQATRGGNRRTDTFEGGEIVHGKRNRGAKKSYVIDSSPDDEEEEEEEEVEVEDEEEDDDDVDDEDDEEEEDEEGTRADEDDEMEELGDEDAEGEDEMEVDAEGDIDMAPKNVGRPLGKNARSTKARPTVKVTTASRATRDEDEDEDEDDDDDELSDPADSDIGDDTIVYGDQTMADEDAEGEEIEVAGDEDDVEEEDEEEDDEITLPQGANGDSELDSEAGSRAETPDLAKMTKRQRARFEDIPQEFMKLPDGACLCFFLVKACH